MVQRNMFTKKPRYFQARSQSQSLTIFLHPVSLINILPVSIHSYLLPNFFSLKCFIALQQQLNDAGIIVYVDPDADAHTGVNVDVEICIYFFFFLSAPVTPEI